MIEIGESVKDLPPELTDRWPRIEWKGWADLRNFVAHQYFNVEPARLFSTVTDEMRGLHKAIEFEIRRLEAESIVAAIQAKALEMSSSSGDFLDAIAGNATSEQIAAMVADIDDLADVGEFLANHGVSIPGYVS